MKKTAEMMCFMGIILLLTGCSVEKTDLKKIKKLPFEIVCREKIPRKFLIKINEKKSKEFRIVFKDHDSIYIARGYGEKERKGFYVKVTGCYESLESVYVYTDLVGPAKEEKQTDHMSEPYVVIKIKRTDKHIVFV